jgi:hypothetical protein
MFKLKKLAVALTLAFPIAASAETNADLQRQIDSLKAEVQELKALVKQQAQQPAAPAAATTAAPAEEQSNRADIERLQVQVDALQDGQETAGMKGLRISAGIDPAYIYNKAKGTSSFAFLNNFGNVNGSGEVFSYDNSFFGLAYIDFQKEMQDNGTKFRLTLMPSKSVGSGFAYYSSIVHEASASIPLTDKQTRLLVGQFPDVSGYQPFVNSFSGQNAITANQLFAGFGEFFITKNILFDFAAPFAYTGVGTDIVRGPWEVRAWLANFGTARNDVNTCGNAAVSPTLDPTTGAVIDPGTSGNTPCSPRPQIAPMFIYNATYAKEEFWGYEFTGFEGNANNWIAGGVSRLDSFEIDGWFTRAEFNANLQFNVGRQKDAAFNGGDSSWWGLSALVSQRVTNRLTLAGRADYLNNDKNGGGTFAVLTTIPSNIEATNYFGSNAGSPYLGDFYNGFGPGDPNAAGYDANKGANRYELSFSATYRLSPYVALRGEVRHDVATTPAFYYWTDQSFRKSNDVYGLQTIVNF